MKARRIRQGGLYRCCIEHLDSMPHEERDKEGAKQQCQQCGAPMVFARGAWEWSPAEEFKQRGQVGAQQKPPQ